MLGGSLESPKGVGNWSKLELEQLKAHSAFWVSSQAVPLVLLEPHSLHRMNKEESGKYLFKQEVQLGKRIRKEGL